MQKARSVSMKRGAAHRDPSDRISREQYNEQTSISLSSAERAHFAFGATTMDLLLERLRPRVRLMAQNRFRKPRDVSRLLNKEGLRTACGEKWTPRLVAFLLKIMFEKTERPISESGLTGMRLKIGLAPGSVQSSVKAVAVRLPHVVVGGQSQKEARDAAAATGLGRSGKRLRHV